MHLNGHKLEGNILVPIIGVRFIGGYGFHTLHAMAMGIPFISLVASASFTLSRMYRTVGLPHRGVFLENNFALPRAWLVWLDMIYRSFVETA